jgi:hypothetical protein
MVGFSWAACTIVGAAKLAATVANIAIRVLMEIVGLLQWVMMP